MKKSEEKFEEIERDIATFSGHTNPPWRKETEKCYKLELTVDSGAHESVTPPDTIPGMIPGKGKHSDPYYAANGTRIENYGAIGIRGLTSEKAPLNCTMQVAGVNKPLVATIDMVEAGHLVVLSKTGGVAKRLSEEDVKRIMKIIKDSPGNPIPIDRKGRKHVIEITVPKKEKSKGKNEMDVDLFIRPATKV